MHDLRQGTSEPIALIVDDDPAMRLLLRQALAKAGLVVEEAADGRQGLIRFEALPAELVLLDVSMPGLDGFATCSRLRNLPGGRDTAVIMVTGLDDTDSIQQAYDVGATDFIAKPVNWPILEYRIRYLLRSQQACKALRKSEKRWAQVQRIAKLGHWDWNIRDNRLLCSDEIYRVLGLRRPAKAVTYERFLRAVHPDDQVFVSNAVDEALNTGKALDVDHRIILPNGSTRSVHEHAEVELDQSGRPVRMQGTVQDITERMKSEAQIRFLAYYDSLTGLPNRQLFAERADRALRESRRNGSRVALFYLDLDQFKYVNDTLGHSAGDELLKQVAQRLTDSIRDSDTVAKAALESQPRSSLSRMGGDEFTILLTGLDKGQQAAQVARRMLENLAQPVRIGKQALYITGSLGIAIYAAWEASAADWAAWDDWIGDTQ